MKPRPHECIVHVDYLLDGYRGRESLIFSGGYGREDYDLVDECLYMLECKLRREDVHPRHVVATRYRIDRSPECSPWLDARTVEGWVRDLPLGVMLPNQRVALLDTLRAAA